jgi:hypothetical protein
MNVRQFFCDYAAKSLLSGTVVRDLAELLSSHRRAARQRTAR